MPGENRIPRLITIPELVSASGIDEPTIMQMIRTGELRSVVLAKKRLIYESSYLAFLEGCREEENARRVANESGNGGYVYFMASDSRKVKIGYSVDPPKRLRGLQAGSSVPLRIIATVPGSPKDERELHRRFKKYRLHLEWFRFAGTLRAFIEALARG